MRPPSIISVHPHFGQRPSFIAPPLRDLMTHTREIRANVEAPRERLAATSSTHGFNRALAGHTVTTTSATAWLPAAACLPAAAPHTQRAVHPEPRRRPATSAERASCTRAVVKVGGRGSARRIPPPPTGCVRKRRGSRSEEH